MTTLKTSTGVGYVTGYNRAYVSLAFQSGDTRISIELSAEAIRDIAEQLVQAADEADELALKEGRRT